MNKEILLNTAYLPPIGYLAKIISAETIILEAYENYIKQSYRNRCEIYGANGKLQLVVPVKKISGSKIPILDLEIDYSTAWKRNHIISIESAYRSSPFFEFYFDDLISVFSKQYKYLFEFNKDLLTVMLSLLNINRDIKLSDNYSSLGESSAFDFRESFHPKKKKNVESKKTENIYLQVFDEKHGFIKDLSIIDLIFNLGPESEIYLSNYK